MHKLNQIIALFQIKIVFGNIKYKCVRLQTCGSIYDRVLSTVQINGRYKIFLLISEIKADILSLSKSINI